MSGHLYQLRSKSERRRGEYVAVGGPWDQYGVILKSEPTADGQYLNLIRGVKKRAGEKPTIRF